MQSGRALRTLESIVGPDNVLVPPETSHLTVGGRDPSIAAVFPSDVAQVQEIVKACSEARLSLLPYGGGTRTWQISRPESFDVALVTARLNGIADYQPENLVLAAEAGATGQQVSDLLADHGQIVALDPPSFPRATVGGIAASRSAGPARLGYGSPRDQVIGLKIVNAEGEIVNAGGRVVKNVSGYDLCKLYTGSFGTLGVIVEVVIRLYPRPERSEAVLLGMDSWGQAEALVASLMDSYLLPRSIELLNSGAASLLPGHRVQAPVVAAVVFDGSPQQLEFQAHETIKIGTGAGATHLGSVSASWHGEWHEALTGIQNRGKSGGLFVVRCLSSDASAVAASAEHTCTEICVSPLLSLGAASGIVKLAVEHLTPEQGQAISGGLRQFLKPGSSASLVSCSPQGGAASDVWQGEVAGLQLMKGIKEKLDPGGLFPTGTMAGGL